MITAWVNERVSPAECDWDLGLTEPVIVSVAQRHQGEYRQHCEGRLTVEVEPCFSVSRNVLITPAFLVSALVLVFHLGLLYLLSLPWFAQSTPLKPRKPKSVALNAYLVSIPVTQNQAEVPRSATVPPEVKPEKLAQGSQPSPIGNKASGAEPAEERANNRQQQVDINTTSHSEVEGLDITSSQHSKVKLSDMSTDSSYDPSANVETQAVTGKGQTVVGTSERSFIGRSYLARQQALAVSSLAKDSAQAYVAKRSLSEMDGEMTILKGGSEYDISKELTLDHQFDPNRIVRIGDTCYRVVKLGDPINSHKENLGFPYFCGEDQVSKSINKGIAEHLSRMNKSVQTK